MPITHLSYFHAWISLIKSTSKEVPMKSIAELIAAFGKDHDDEEIVQSVNAQCAERGIAASIHFIPPKKGGVRRFMMTFRENGQASMATQLLKDNNSYLFGYNTVFLTIVDD